MPKYRMNLYYRRNLRHRYQDLLYCNSSQYILSTYNSQHNNNNNNVVLAMTMPYSDQDSNPRSSPTRGEHANHYIIDAVLTNRLIHQTNK
jgi:hypothetical protein